MPDAPKTKAWFLSEDMLEVRRLSMLRMKWTADVRRFYDELSRSSPHVLLKYVGQLLVQE